MSSRSRRVSFAVCLAVSALAAGACRAEPAPGSAPPGSTRANQEAEAGPVQPGGKLVVAVAAETDNFSPYGAAWTTSSFPVANALFDPLVVLDPDGVAHPYLAASISSSADFKTWTIGVRPNVTFHDGTAVDAAAIKKNLDTGKNTGLTAQAFALVDAIDAPDATTVVVTFKRPWSTFPMALTTQAGYMAAPSMLADPAGGDAKIVGSGPFVFEDRQRGSVLKTRKNTSYWQKSDEGATLPYLDGIDFRIITDPNTRRSAFQAGDVDAIQMATAGEMIFAQEVADRRVAQQLTDIGTETNEVVLAFNTAKEPFNDPVARQAVAHALDQDNLAETAYQGAFPAAWSMFEEGSPWYISKQEAGYPAHDVARAKALATEYQQRHGKPLQFSLLAVADAGNLAAVQAIQAQLTEADITLDIESMDVPSLISRVIVSGDYQASTFQLWSAPAPDQGYVFLATPANPTGLSLNYTRFDDPEIVAALDEYRSTTDKGKQKQAIARVQRRLAVELPVVFLYRTRTAFLYANHMHGITAATVPGTDTRAVASYVTAPFYSTVWIDH